MTTVGFGDFTPKTAWGFVFVHLGRKESIGAYPSPDRMTDIQNRLLYSVHVIEIQRARPTRVTSFEHININLHDTSMNVEGRRKSRKRMFCLRGMLSLISTCFVAMPAACQQVCELNAFCLYWFQLHFGRWESLAENFHTAGRPGIMSCCSRGCANAFGSGALEPKTSFGLRLM